MRRALLVALALTGCGDGEERLTVSAATSLKTALTAYAGPEVRLSFAGSDELAAQIRQGVRPDVYAAANTALPAQLFAEGLVEEPVVFATNRLVIATPADGSVGRIEDLERRGVKIAIGATGVPVGAYARQVLGRLGAGAERRILANVRSEEPDVAGVVGKVATGAVDAGFVYVTDVAAADGRLRAIALPDRLQPTVRYAVAVVEGAPPAAEAFVDGLLSGRGAAALRSAGFGPPP